MSCLSIGSSVLHKVQLYRYDLSMGMARTMGMALIGMHMEGIWHTSIVVYGTEFYFDGGVGIVEHSVPGQTRFGPPYRTEPLGQTSKTEKDWRTWVRAQGRSGAFGPTDYNLLEKNCNHFTQAASRFLLSCDIPADIRDMIPRLLETPMGRSLFPMLQNITSAGEPSSPRGPTHGPSLPLSSSATHNQTASSPAHHDGRVVSSHLGSDRNALSEEDESDLLTYQAILESHPMLSDGDGEARTAGRQSILSALQLLHTIVSNVLCFPDEPKYRTISTSGKAYTSKLQPLEESGVTAILQLAGFELRDRKKQGNNSTTTTTNNNISDTAVTQSKLAEQKVGEEQEWHLSDERASRGVLEHVAQVLNSTMSNLRRSARAT